MGVCASCGGREQATHPLFEGAPAWEQRLPQGNEWMPPAPEPERVYSFEKYEVERELGRGEFGVVSAVVEKATGNRFAVKSISKEWAQDQGWTEAEIMFHLAGCPNVLRCHDVFEDSLDVHLVLELCSGGSWYDRLAAKGVFPEAKAAEVTRVLLRTVHQCHSLGVVHRDIKADNLLWSDDGDEPSQLRLADWGLAELAPKRPTLFNNTLERSSRAAHSRPRNDAPAVGSTWYMSPEVLHHKGAGKPADVWSIGILLYLTLTGRAPFDAPTEPQVWYAIKYEPLRFLGPACQKISVNAKDILSRMLTKDPRRRATVPELLAHPWLTGHTRQSSGRARSANASKRSAAAPSAPLPAPISPGGAASGSGTRGALGEPLVPPDVVVSRLQAYGAMGALDKRVRREAVPLLHEKQVSGLHKLFKALDVDCDGYLSLGELHNAVMSRGWHATEQQAKDLLTQCDLDSDGALNAAEFLAATMPQSHLQDSTLLEQLYCSMFELQDGGGGDRTSGLDASKLAKALGGPHGAQVDGAAVLEAVDLDRDGVLSLDDFCAYFLRQHEGDQGLPASPVHLAPGGSTLRAPRAKTANTHLSITALHDVVERSAASNALEALSPVKAAGAAAAAAPSVSGSAMGGPPTMRAKTATAQLGGRRRSWEVPEGEDDGPNAAAVPGPAPSSVTAVTAVTAVGPGELLQEASLAEMQPTMGAGARTGAGAGAREGGRSGAGAGVAAMPRPLAMLRETESPLASPTSGGGEGSARAGSRGRGQGQGWSSRMLSEPGHTLSTPGDAGRHQLVQFNLASVELEPPASAAGWRPNASLPYDGGRKIAKKSSMKKRSPPPPALDDAEVLDPAVASAGRRPGSRGVGFRSVGGGVDMSGLPAHLQGTGIVSRESSLKRMMAASPARTTRPGSPSISPAGSGPLPSFSPGVRRSVGGAASEGGAVGTCVAGTAAAGALRPLSPLSTPPLPSAPLPNSLCTPRPSSAGFEFDLNGVGGSVADEVDPGFERSSRGEIPGLRLGRRSGSKGTSRGSSRGRSRSRSASRGGRGGGSRGGTETGAAAEAGASRQEAGGDGVGKDGGMGSGTPTKRGHSLASSASSLNAPSWRDGLWRERSGNGARSGDASASGVSVSSHAFPSRASSRASPSRTSPSPVRASFRASPHLAQRPSFGAPHPLSRASSASSIFSRVSRNSRNSRVSCNSRGGRRAPSRASSTTSLLYSPSGGYRLADPAPWSPLQEGGGSRGSDNGGVPGSRHGSRLPSIKAWGEDSCLTLANQLGLDGT